MQFIKNERGSILVFVTLITVLLLIMVGMGLDTGQLTYVRNQGQAAVDAAALAAASALPTNNDAQVKARVASYNSKSFNDYVGEPTNPLGGANITYVAWDPITQSVQNLPSITGANGVRVALEQNNPYTGAASKTGITTPVFLTPLMRLLGQNAPTTSNISVSAVAVLTATPLIPIALYDSLCNGSNTVPNVDLRMENQNPKNGCWTTYLDNPVNVPKLRALFDNSGTCSGLPKDLVDVGTDIFVQNGVGATVFNNATNLFINNYPGQCWMVPVVPDTGSPCNQTRQIKDWARICPTAVVKNGANGYITVNLTCGQTLFNTRDNLCFANRLVRDTKSGM